MFQESEICNVNIVPLTESSRKSFFVRFLGDYYPHLNLSVEHVVIHATEEESILYSSVEIAQFQLSLEKRKVKRKEERKEERKVKREEEREEERKEDLTSKLLK